MALTAYQTQCQRFLHDTNAAMWPVTELTDYINEARNRICADTYCLRQVVTGLSTVAGTELYSVASIPVAAGYTPINVMNIDLYYGNMRVALDYYPFRQFNVRYRAWKSFTSRPLAFTRMGANYFYLGPTPDQVYSIDINCSVIPPPLTSDATAEPMPEPFTHLIKYWACYLAKFKEQSYKEAEMFKAEYIAERRNVATVWMSGVVPSLYGG